MINDKQKEHLVTKIKRIRRAIKILKPSHYAEVSKDKMGSEELSLLTLFQSNKYFEVLMST
jgi:hypothetical protein